MAAQPNDFHGSLRLLAPAKINLFLHVTGRRDDGYHTLESLVVFADIGDDLAVRSAPDVRLHIEGPQSATLVDDQAENLIMRAAKALRPSTNNSPGAAFTLMKHLPVASGIGGGSSDAASAVRLLEALWRLDLDDTSISQTLLDLGADVPVCHYGRPALMSGIGEVLTPWEPLPPLYVVLANPRVGVPTGAVFKRLERFSPLGLGTQPPADQGFEAFVEFLSGCHNSLERPALTIEPVVGRVLEAMGELPGCALNRMSGSGATCFGLFADGNAAREGARVLAERHPDWWVAGGQILKTRPEPVSS